MFVGIDDIIACVKEMAPEELAEPWDNCGLIIDSDNRVTENVIACLDVTPEVVGEAVAARAGLIISHHPLIFKPIKSIGGGYGRDLAIRELIRNDVALYSAHTNVDKTYGGLNDLLAGIIGIEIPPPGGDGGPLSCYRIGDLPRGYTADEFNNFVMARLKLEALTVSADNRRRPATVRRVAVTCGSYGLGAEFLINAGADALLCGEIKYHDALDLSAAGVYIIQAGHHETERFFISLITKWINDRLPDIRVTGVGFSDSPMEIYGG